MLDRKEYYIKNREKLLEYANQYRLENKEKIKEYQREYQREYQKEYYIKYLKRKIEKIREYQNCKYKTDLKYNLGKKISRAIRKSLKGNKNGRSWETLVDYTLNDLIKRLSKTMPEGYAWNDYLEGKLELDHKIPISVFNYTSMGHLDFKKCWSLDNLQLLPVKENRIKSNKLTKPFQPALQI